MHGRILTPFLVTPPPARWDFLAMLSQHGQNFWRKKEAAGLSLRFSAMAMAEFFNPPQIFCHGHGRILDLAGHSSGIYPE